MACPSEWPEAPRLAQAMSEAHAADREEERRREQFINMLHGVAATLAPVAYRDLLLFADERPLSRLIVSFMRVPEHLAQQRNMRNMLFSKILAVARASSAGQQYVKATMAMGRTLKPQWDS